MQLPPEPTPEQKLWLAIQEEYKYQEIREKSDLTLARLSLIAPQYGPPEDPFLEVRQRRHDRDLGAALFLRPAKSHGEYYGPLSGWYITLDGFFYAGTTSKTIEHIYQATKFARDFPDIAREVHSKERPRDVKATAAKEEYRSLIRSDWDQVKEMAMLGPALAIATQSPQVAATLAEVHPDAVIVEDAKKDSFWGRGEDFSGGNGLGITWMLARNIIERGDAKSLQEEIADKFRIRPFTTVGQSG